MHGGVFAPLVERLRDRRSLYLVDLPGHGLSEERDALDPERDVERLLALLPPAPWLGWSLGGLYALEAAARDPQRVEGVVAIACSPCFVRREDWPWAVDHAVFRQFHEDLEADYEATIRRFLALEVQGDVAARSELRWLRERLAERPPPAPAALASGLHLLESEDRRAALKELAVPSLWIAGQHDRLVPWRALEQSARLSGGRLLRIDGCAHAPFLVQPERIADAVLASTVCRHAAR